MGSKTLTTMKLLHTKLIPFLVIGLAFSERTKTPTPQFATAELALDIDTWLAKSRPNNFNSIYSPVSIYNILAGLYFGTAENSKTRLELQEKFNFKPQFNATNYATRLAKLTNSEALKTFNSYVFHKANMTPVYEKELEMLNFKKQRFDTFTGKEKMLNEQVEKDTDGMIKEMFSPGSFDDLTNLILLNTILFEGEWDQSRGVFEELRTKTLNRWYTGTKEDSAGPFAAEFMDSKDRKLQFYESERVLYASLKFTSANPGKPVFMTIVMPKTGAKISAHQVNFNEVNFDAMRQREVELLLPKWEVKDEHDLINFLAYKNATRLLEAGTANLDRMFGNSDNFVGQFNQKASIKVNEKGAKAAAATAVRVMMKSMAPKKRKLEIVRPFKYFIHSLKLKMDLKEGQKQSGNLFFAGVVNCPMNNCDETNEVTDEVDLEDIK